MSKLIFVVSIHIINPCHGVTSCDSIILDYCSSSIVYTANSIILKLCNMIHVIRTAGYLDHPGMFRTSFTSSCGDRSWWCTLSWFVPRKTWLATEGSRKSRIDDCQFRNEKPVEQCDFEVFSIIKEQSVKTKSSASGTSRSTQARKTAQKSKRK